MSLRVRGYDAEGHKVYDDLGPGYARASWRGSIDGQMVSPLPGKPQVDRAELARKGWETRKLRGQGLER